MASIDDIPHVSAVLSGGGSLGNWDKPEGMSRDEYLNQFRSNVPKGFKSKPQAWKTKLSLEDNVKRRKMMRANKQGASHLEASGGSTCFDSLEWDQVDGDLGVVTAVFLKGGGTGTYYYECTRDEFQEWAQGSQGGYFNDSGLYWDYL